MIEYNGPKLLDQRKMSELIRMHVDDPEYQEVIEDSPENQLILEFIVAFSKCENAGMDIEVKFIQYIEGRL